MSKRITLRELAKMLDLSISTVSKSLSDSEEISLATKKRVKEFARLYNYHPNRMAKGIKSGQSNSIGVIVPHVMNNYFSEVLSSIENKLSKKGYSTVTAISNETIHKEYLCIKMMLDVCVDGIILCPSRETSLKNEMDHLFCAKNMGIPIVLFDRVDNSVPFDKIISNDFDASYFATEFLVSQLRCKNLLMVSTIGDQINGRLRQQGFISALQKHEISEDCCHIIKSPDLKKFNRDLHMLLRTYRIDGIFGVNDVATMNTCQIIRSLEFKCHEGLSIIAFCDQKQVMYNPSIIRIDQKASIVGASAVETIFEKMEDKNNTSSRTKVVKAKLLLT